MCTPVGARINQGRATHPKVEFRSPLAQTLKGLTSGGCPAWAGGVGVKLILSLVHENMFHNHASIVFPFDSPPPFI